MTSSLFLLDAKTQVTAEFQLLQVQYAKLRLSQVTGAHKMMSTCVEIRNRACGFVGYKCSKSTTTYATLLTVPFKSIRQSRVTRPSKTLKCHGGHGNFCKVLNSFSDHVPNIENFRHLRRKTAENFPKFWTCHGKFGRLPKPKFRQACHRSHPLPN